MKIKIKDANTHINRMSGYGQLSAALAVGLEARGHDVYFDYITGCDDAKLDELAKKKFTHTDDTIYLWIRPPHYVKDEEYNQSYRNVFFTMHEKETFDGWKSDWCELLNKTICVITPTHWNKNVFKENGVTVPIHVIPLGVSIQQFRPWQEDTFNVLAVHDALGSDASRENWKETIEVFEKSFAGYSNVKLTIKSWNMKTIQFTEFMKEKSARVYPVTTNLYAGDMADLYRRSHVFVKNSTREGWSLPLTEAMACGLAVIVRKCQVLLENVGNYPNVSWFSKPEQLQYYFDDLYKKWEAQRKQLQSISWKRTIEGVEEVLKTL